MSEAIDDGLRSGAMCEVIQTNDNGDELDQKNELSLDQEAETSMENRVEELAQGDAEVPEDPEISLQRNGNVSPWGDEEVNLDSAYIAEDDDEEDAVDGDAWKLRVLQRVSEAKCVEGLGTDVGYGSNVACAECISERIVHPSWRRVLVSVPLPKAVLSLSKCFTNVDGCTRTRSMCRLPTVDYIGKQPCRAIEEFSEFCGEEAAVSQGPRQLRDYRPRGFSACSSKYSICKHRSSPYAA